MTVTAKQPTAAESHAPSHAQGLGDKSSIWFKLTPLLKGGLDNPLHIIMQMAERYGPVIPINLANQRIILLSEPEHFKHVLVTKADAYIKYFDGLKPIFGKSMITNDGVLWQKIRMPQQPAFHPDMFAEYIPYFLAAIRTKMDIWSDVAKSGETIEMVEQTWTLAADMICKALFDRDMPFNPHFVFKCVKTYTDVMNHKEIRLKRQAGEIFEITDEDAAKAMEVWASVPPAVFGADPREERERTLLKMIEAAVADPSMPEFDQQQAIDELKQYLWAGTETTALTLAWALYETARHPEAAERIRKEGERSMATASRPPPTIRPSPIRAPSSRKRCASTRRSGVSSASPTSTMRSAASRSTPATAWCCSPTARITTRASGKRRRSSGPSAGWPAPPRSR